MQFSSVQLLEIGVVITTLLYNYFLINQKIYCWLFGFLASVFGLIIFYEKQLFGQVALHIFYAIMAIYGFIIWGKRQDKNYVINWPLKYHLFAGILGVLFTIAAYYCLYYFYHQESNILDIIITIFCIIATFKEAHKVLSAWLYWIVLNIASLVLYLQSNLKIYALLMFVYALLSVRGYLVWRLDFKRK